MSLKHVLLMVLKKQSATGYGITKWFDGPLGYFWDTSHQRVYRALAKLHEDGWVSFEVVPQHGRPDKKVYAITPLGEQILDGWMRKPLPLPKVNEPFLVKLFAADTKYLGVLIDEANQRLEEHRAVLEDYRLVEETYFSAGQLSAEQQLMYLTLRRGQLYEESSIQWISEALSVLVDLHENNNKNA
ncbi:MAG: PadR family transcriptional regulator [Pseudomonadales bacterium]|jgi:PadR family transcriptional regulator, regulatory protein AphA|nr:PadR family transcriptional regulator [Pseudomonadales bacterium]MCK5792060.1 PadR family transcriptional regulator [Ketobacter sp.]MEC8811400.1 PadR family transcriptional regulator [Pseudomonadota bacterium]HAG93244.1 PadR family transcriptional regulator [Gammaproteobacteria bacterium]MAQ23893.1 PadR family transcriptional regulator [Pseudomonadales bacterium]|tara:strand:- start:841 stop:1398 length:558 start_codon:yes stop_codon:yes gene_type:complete